MTRKKKPPPPRDKKAKRVPMFPWPRTPLAEGMTDRENEPIRAAIESGDMEAFQRAVEAQREHPDAIASRLIEEALQNVHLDARVHRDAPWLSNFVMLMRELLADAAPGMTLVEILKPLHKALSQHGGGRPREVEPDAVQKTRTLLEQHWHPAPVKEAASRLGISERTVRRASANAKKR